MVYIHSTYYIKSHLLCDIRDSAQAAGGVDFSILWPGKLWKTIVFRQIKPAPFREEATIFTIAEKAKINSSFTLSAQCRIVSQARRKPPFYIRTEAKRMPHIWGPMQASRPSQHGDTPAYHPPQAAFLCRAVQRLAYTFMGSKGRFPFFGSTQIIQGFSPPVGLRPKK